MLGDSTLLNTHGAGGAGMDCDFFYLDKGITIQSMTIWKLEGQGIIGDELVFSDGSKKSFGTIDNVLSESK